MNCITLFTKLLMDLSATQEWNKIDGCMEQLGKYMQKLRVVKNLQTLVWPYDSFKMPRITGMRLNVSAHK